MSFNNSDYYDSSTDSFLAYIYSGYAAVSGTLITSGVQSGTFVSGIYLYSWQEVEEDPATGYYFSGAPAGRIGIGNAFEVNKSMLLSGTPFLAWIHYAGQVSGDAFYVFDKGIPGPPGPAGAAGSGGGGISGIDLLVQRYPSQNAFYPFPSGNPYTFSTILFGQGSGTVSPISSGTNSGQYTGNQLIASLRVPPSGSFSGQQVLTITPEINGLSGAGYVDPQLDCYAFRFWTSDVQTTPFPVSECFWGPVIPGGVTNGGYGQTFVFPNQAGFNSGISETTYACYIVISGNTPTFCLAGTTTSVPTFAVTNAVGNLVLGVSQTNNLTPGYPTSQGGIVTNWGAYLSGIGNFTPFTVSYTKPGGGSGSLQFINGILVSGT